jgi:hypothetical protein
MNLKVRKSWSLTAGLISTCKPSTPLPAVAKTLPRVNQIYAKLAGFFPERLLLLASTRKEPYERKYRHQAK